MACRASCIEGDSCSNVNVTLNLRTNPLHVVSLCISNSKYECLRIVSNVCMNRSVHFVYDTECHKALNFSTWSFESLSPFYFCALTSTSGPKHICMSLMHCSQSLILFMCVAHHIAGVAFKMTSNDNSLYYLGTCNSNAIINIFFSVSPSYLGGSYSYVPIQCKYWFIQEHLLVNTSCILYYQFSRQAFDFDVHELKLLQLSTPSIVGST